jgi:hypothetical protein
MNKEATLDFLIFMAILGAFGYIWRKWQLSLVRFRFEVLMEDFCRKSSNHFFDREYSFFVIRLIEASVATLILIFRILEVFMFISIFFVAIYLIIGPAFF